MCIQTRSSGAARREGIILVTARGATLNAAQLRPANEHDARLCSADLQALKKNSGVKRDPEVVTAHCRLVNWEGRR